MKRILILNLANKGGSAIYAKEIIDKLEHRKYVINTNHSLVPVPSDIDEYWYSHKNSKEFVLFTLFLLPIYSAKLFIYLLKNRFDVLYLPYIHFWSPIFVYLFRLFKKEVVITLHDGVSHSKNGGLPIQSLVNFCIKRATKLIFLTNHVKSETENKLSFVKEIPKFIVPHGLLVPPGLNEKNRTELADKNLLFFGKVLKSKGVDLLLETLLDIDSDLYNKLYIVGKQSYDLRVPQEIVSKVEVVDRFVDENEIASFFNNSYLLVLPYTAASQSGVLTIGISAGIPMVISKVGGLEEQLSDDEARFIIPKKEELKNALVDLLTNDLMYQQYLSKIDEKRASLSWVKIAKDIDYVLESK